MQDMTTKNYKTVVPEKCPKEFGASLKSVKTLLLTFRAKFEAISAIQCTKQYSQKSEEFLEAAAREVEATKQTVKAAKATFNVYLTAK